MCISLQKIWKTTIAAVFLTAVVVVTQINAATVTKANDYISTLVAGQSANHKLVFTTLNGVLEGQTIQLTFSSAFDTSLITEDDVDINDDGSALTTAADCSGAENASVTIAADVITVNVCPGDGGAIAALSEVIIDIGSQASDSGIGVNHIINPASVGTYFVSIGGTFADSGSIALPISSQGTAGISATVTQIGGGCGGGGCGGAGGGDITAPTISNIVVSNVTDTSTTITWDTNENANSQVYYGLTNVVEIGSVNEPNMKQVHSIELVGLQPGTQHYFQIRSADIVGNIGYSVVQTFTTTDTVGPVISDIAVENITGTTARVVWSTDENSTSLVNYGVNIGYGSSESNGDYVAQHAIVLTNLIEGQEYQFRVTSVDAATNSSVSGNNSFITNQDLPPANVSSFGIIEGDTELLLGWTNPIDVDLAGIKVIYCLNELPDAHDDADCNEIYNGLLEAFTHSDLTNNTSYYYGVFSYDTAGQFASGALGTDVPKGPEGEEPLLPPIDDPGVPAPDVPGAPAIPDEGGAGGLPDAPDVIPGSEDDSIPMGAGVVSNLDFSDVAFLVANKNIVLTPGTFKTVDVLGTELLRVEVPESKLRNNVDTVNIQIGSQTYLMVLENKNSIKYYTADVLTPFASQTYTFELTAEYADGSSESVSSLLRVVQRAHAKQDIDGEEATLTGVQIKLNEVFGDTSIPWDGSFYGQMNPQTSPDNGTYAYYVLNGTYKLEASLDGFEAYVSQLITVDNNIVNESVTLIPLVVLEDLDDSDKDTDKATTGDSKTIKLEEKPAGFFGAATVFFEDVLETPVVESVQQALETIREIQAVQSVADVATPTLAITAGVSVVAMTIAFDFLPFLQYIFTAPILFFWRRKRKGFGTIYNSLTKIPVDLAVVRLFKVDPSSKNIGRLVKSRVTDREGRFFFLVQPGTYRIVVSKKELLYPTKILSQSKEDGEYLDLYHGEEITVTERDAVLSPNIPLDPGDATNLKTPKKVVWQERMRKIQNVVAVSGVLASIVFAVIRPSVFAALMIAIQIGVYTLARRLAAPAKPKNWGIIYDKQTRRPMGRVIARIFEPKYNKLLDTQVTDSKGRYAFLLGPGEFYAVFEKEGYRSVQVKPIDFKGRKGAQGFSIDLQMQNKEDT